VFVVATANDVSRLPPEFTRKGRFDETFFVGLPTSPERAAIWEVHLRRPRRMDEGIDVGRLAQISEGYAGAEIAEAVVGGMYRAFDDGGRPVRQADIEKSLRESVPLSRSHAPLLRRLAAWGPSTRVPPGGRICLSLTVRSGLSFLWRLPTSVGAARGPAPDARRHQ
jgi:SpoVK/Ycf46/Vps4 family AAA+-type ATPase